MLRLATLIETRIRKEDGFELVKKALEEAKSKFCGAPKKGGLFGKSEYEDHLEKSTARYEAAGVPTMNKENYLTVLLSLLLDPKNGGTGANSLKTAVLIELTVKSSEESTPTLDAEVLNQELCKQLQSQNQVMEDAMVNYIVAFLGANSKKITHKVVKGAIDEGDEQYKYKVTEKRSTEKRRREKEKEPISEYTSRVYERSEKQLIGYKQFASSFLRTPVITMNDYDGHMDSLLTLLENRGGETPTSLKGLVLKNLFLQCCNQESAIILERGALVDEDDKKEITKKIKRQAIFKPYTPLMTDEMKIKISELLERGVLNLSRVKQSLVEKLKALPASEPTSSSTVEKRQ